MHSCCGRGGGQRVWLPLQGHEWLCDLSHSWVVLTPAWARKREIEREGRRERERRGKKMTWGWIFIYTVEIVTEGEGWEAEGREMKRRVSEDEMEKVWLSFRYSFLLEYNKKVQLYDVLWGSDEFRPPCGASSRGVYHCSLLTSAPGDGGVKYSRIAVDMSEQESLHAFLYKAGSLLEIPRHFEFLIGHFSSSVTCHIVGLASTGLLAWLPFLCENQGCSYSFHAPWHAGQI